MLNANLDLSTPKHRYLSSFLLQEKVNDNYRRKNYLDILPKSYNQFKSISTEFCYFGENDHVIEGSKLILSFNNINHILCECLKSFKGLNCSQTINYNANDNQVR